MKVRVYYEDTDAGGIVYHTNYIKYCERARSELFFQQNQMPLDENSGFVVKNIEADFLGFATLGEMLEVKTSLIKKKAVSIILLQEIYNKNNKKIFSMKIILAFIKEGKLSPIPDKFHKILENQATQ